MPATALLSWQPRTWASFRERQQPCAARHQSLWGQRRLQQQQQQRGSSLHLQALADPAEHPATSASPLSTVDFPSSPFGRHLVVAVDSTEESVEAFKWTLLHLYRRGDTVTVLHVMPDAHAGPASGSIYYIPPDDAETERCLWTQAREFIDDNFVAAGRKQGIDVQVMLCKEKHKGVGHALCKKAEELGANPLVLAAHNKSRFEEIIMGSVSKFCVNHARTPVLLLHPFL